MNVKKFCNRILVQGKGLDGAFIQTHAAVDAGFFIDNYAVAIHTEGFRGTCIYASSTTGAFILIHVYSHSYLLIILKNS